MATMGSPFGDDFDWVTEEDKREAQEHLKASGAAGLQKFLNKKLDDWREIPLNIGVTGASGCGKSTFINTIRGLTAGDAGAAAVGVTECTMEPTKYPHPQHGSFTLWDLPGVGTPNFPRESYLEKVGFEKYDFFLIMSSRRFTENDLWLGKEVQQRGKLFFFIRTRIDEDMRNDKDDHPDTHDENKVLEQVRGNCQSNLDEQGITSHVFLISGKKRYETSWDFPALNKKLIDNLPGLKRHAMVLSLTANSKEVIEEKYNSLWSRIWMIAGISAAAALAPIPGLSIAVDVALLMKEINHFKQQLNLDEESLNKLSATYGIPLSQLSGAVSQVIPVTYLSETTKWLCMLFQEEAVETAAEEFFRYIPFVGSVIAAGISFTTTVVVLRRVLDQLKEAALHVLQMIIDNSKTDL